MYADVAQYMFWTVAISVMALYIIFGEPNPLRPNPLSLEKFAGYHNHLRKTVGYMLDSHQMRVSILEYKRNQLLTLLTQWLEMPTTFTLHQVATLHGTLESMMHYSAWACPWFFAIQNAMRTILKLRYHIIKWTMRRQCHEQELRELLPEGLLHQIQQIIPREHAQLIWDKRHSMPSPITTAIRGCMQALYDNLSNWNNDWGQQIGLIVSRDPSFTSFGDASEDAGGAYCNILQFWFQVNWSPAVLQHV
jgi:hypothetical protein